MMSELSDQEIFWKGSFGSEYIDRNKSNQLLSANISMFSKMACLSSILSKMLLMNSCLSGTLEIKSKGMA